MPNSALFGSGSGNTTDDVVGVYKYLKFIKEKVSFCVKIVR